MQQVQYLVMTLNDFNILFFITYAPKRILICKERSFFHLHAYSVMLMFSVLFTLGLYSADDVMLKYNTIFSKWLYYSPACFM